MPQQSLEEFARAVAIEQALLKSHPEDRRFRIDLRNMLANRALTYRKLGRHASALKDWHQAIKVDPDGPKSVYRYELALSLVHIGDASEALRLAIGLRSEATHRWHMYKMCCIFAACSIRPNVIDAISASTGRVVSHRCRKESLAFLKSAAEKGYFRPSNNRTSIESDPDLNALRDLPEFQALVRRVRLEAPVVASKPPEAELSNGPVSARRPN